MKATPKSDKSLFQRLLPNIGLSLFALILSIVAAELILHFFLPAPVPGNVTIHQLSTDPLLLYEPRPNAYAFYDGVPHRVNSDGFRDNDFAIEKTEGVKRIAFIGDSIVYGYGVTRTHSVPKQLQQVFEKEGKKFEVMNFGVSGYDTEQAVEFLKVKALKYKPDTVVLGYCLNDVRYASWELETFWSSFTETANDPSISPFRKTLAWLFIHSRILRLLNKNFHIQKRAEFLQGYPLLNYYVERKAKKNQDPPDSEYAQLEQKIEQEAVKAGTSAAGLDFMMKEIGFRNEMPIYRHHWKQNQLALEELKKLSETYHFNVVVLIFPLFSEMQHYPLAPLHEFLNRQFTSFGFTVMDPLELARDIFIKEGAGAITTDGVHLTPEGARKVAEYIAAKGNWA